MIECLSDTASAPKGCRRLLFERLRKSQSSGLLGGNVAGSTPVARSIFLRINRLPLSAINISHPNSFSASFFPDKNLQIELELGCQNLQRATFNVRQRTDGCI
jgi:hypothetical protein